MSLEDISNDDTWRNVELEGVLVNEGNQLKHGQKDDADRTGSKDSTHSKEVPGSINQEVSDRSGTVKVTNIQKGDLVDQVSTGGGGKLVFRHANGEMWSGFSFSADDVANVAGDTAFKKPDNDDDDAAVMKSNNNDDANITKRRRKPTEKGLQYKQDVATENREKLYRRMQRKKGTIEDLLYTPKNASAVKEELQLLDGTFALIMAAVEDCKEYFSDADFKQIEDWFDNQDEELCAFKRKVHHWLKEAEDELEKKTASSKASSHGGSSKSKSSRTSRSSKSSSSSTKEKAIAERIHLAELQAEAALMEKKRNVEFEAKALQMQEKLEKAMARAKIYEEYDKKSVKEEREIATDGKNILYQYSEKPSNLQQKSSLDANAKPFDFNKMNIPRNRSEEIINKESESARFPKSYIPSFNLQNQEEVIRQPKMQTSLGDTSSKDVNVLCQLLRQQAAPEVQIDVFDGNPLNFKYFMALFKEVVETKIEDPRGRLTRLIRYTSGEAKDLIKHCIELPSHLGYKNAMGLLYKRYGDPHKLLAAHRAEIKKWPSVKVGDAAAFRKFYNFLIRCQSIMTGNNWNIMDSPETICMLLSKLPGHMRDRWNREVYNIRTRHGKEPALSDLIDFVDKETILVNDSLFSKEALDQFIEQKEKPDRSRKARGVKNYAVVSQENKSDKNKKVDDINNSKCPLCNNQHDLDDCKTFISQSIEERSKFLYKNKLCYGCYKGISKVHNGKSCKQRRTCKTCKGNHPTGLHGYKPKRDDNNKDETKKEEPPLKNASVKCSKVISMSVVPIKICHPDSNKVLAVHAMLDNCSQGTFVKEDIVSALGLQGIPTTIAVKTLSGETSEETIAVEGLKVSSSAEDPKWISLPRTFTKNELPVDCEEIATPGKIKRWKYLDEIAKEICQDDKMSVSLLIGANCKAALEPKRFIPSQEDGPYAVKTELGWCIVGPIVQPGTAANLKCNRVAVMEATSKQIGKHHFAIEDNIKETGIKDLLHKIYNADFIDCNQIQPSNQSKLLCNADELSWEDQKFLKIMDDSVTRNGKQYQLPLPFRKEPVVLHNNKRQAEKRLMNMKKRFLRDKKFYNDYCSFMEEIISKGWARKVEESEVTSEDCWYIPHHGVYHPKKPDKIRVVFDCSAEYKGSSLNQQLISGPDLTNQIVGVLTRFREDEIAFMADIEKMFYQVQVPAEQRKYLRFLWWENNDISKEPSVHELCVHLQGGVSSPGCSNYALKKTSIDYEEEFGADAAKALRRNFYVDDLLKSMPDVSSTIILIKMVTAMCAAGGFKLTKFISNSEEVLRSIPEDLRRKGVKDQELCHEELPTDRALGVQWNIETDKLEFKVTMKEKPMTRRGLLSLLSSVYDPLGLVAPFILEGRKIIQQLCLENKGWDDKISQQSEKEWYSWVKKLESLEGIKISRCLKPKGFGNVKDCSIHHFADACETGYGTASYLRLVNEDEQIHCSLIIGKSRVTPSKYVSIPRLELTAATLAIKVSNLLKRELDLFYVNQPLKEYFWTDSQVVLGYIRNEKKRFKIFVANRIQMIRDSSDISQWRHVNGRDNPADDASRGLETRQQEKVQRWFNGPNFLWQPSGSWDSEVEEIFLDDDDPELKQEIKVNVTKMEISNSMLSRLENSVSTWTKMKRIIAWVLKYKNQLLLCSKKEIIEDTNQQLSVDLIEKAGTEIIKMVQRRCFSDEIKKLEIKAANERSHLSKGSSLYKLDPFIDVEGIIHVGGRLRRSNLDQRIMHPIILPRKSIVASRIIEWCHKKCGHGGRNLTLNEVRSSGFWIINANSAVRSIINQCVICRRFRGQFATQKMADLPEERLDDSPPFTHVGLDMFGPFLVKSGRKEMKHYGAIFTCMASRGVHIEVVHSMETDSFIMSLRRFIARRGNIRTIRSDNGSNFVGAEKELNKAFMEMNHDQISNFLQNLGTDWCIWKRNPPYGSHFGGVWERQIRTARAILSSLLATHGQSLNPEALQTLMTEVEAIVNSRPLTVETIGDGTSEAAISPSNLLTMKSKVIMPPPGTFPKADLYSKRRWRRVQHIANEFWTRWRKEFLTTLQERKKWNTPQRNFEIGDIVLLKADGGRNTWPLARIIEVEPDVKGQVRSVKIKCGEGQNSSNEILRRPISKLVLLVENSSVGSH